MVKPLPIVCRALGSVFSTVSKNLVSNITLSVGSLSFHPGRGGLQDKGRQLRGKRPGMGKQACNPSSSDRRTVPNLENPGLCSNHRPARATQDPVSYNDNKKEKLLNGI